MWKQFKLKILILRTPQKINVSRKSYDEINIYLPPQLTHGSLPT